MKHFDLIVEYLCTIAVAALLLYRGIGFSDWAWWAVCILTGVACGAAANRGRDGKELKFPLAWRSTLDVAESNFTKAAKIAEDALFRAEALRRECDGLTRQLAVRTPKRQRASARAA